MPGTTPIVGDLLQLKVYCYVNSQIGINTTHWVVGGVTAGGLTLAQISLAWETALESAYKAWMSTTTFFLGTTVQNLSPPITTPWVSDAFAGAGTVLGGYGPRQVAGLIRWKTALGGRQNTGRIYVPFPALGLLDVNGTLTLDGDDALLDIMNAYGITNTFTQGGAATTIAGVIFHRATNTYSFINEAQYSDQLATQKRRGYFGRINVQTI